jgi:hypothetical protein
VGYRFIFCFARIKVDFSGVEYLVGFGKNDDRLTSIAVEGKVKKS